MNAYACVCVHVYVYVHTSMCTTWSKLQRWPRYWFGTSTYKRVTAIFLSTAIIVITIGLQKKCQTPAGHSRKFSAGPPWRTQALYQVVIYVHVCAALLCRHVATGDNQDYNVCKRVKSKQYCHIKARVTVAMRGITSSQCDHCAAQTKNITAPL